MNVGSIFNLLDRFIGRRAPEMTKGPAATGPSEVTNMPEYIFTPEERLALDLTLYFRMRTTPSGDPQPETPEELDAICRLLDDVQEAA